MKKTGWAILLALCCIGGYLVLPSNYYLRRALIHLLPKIDQYPIFENRMVKAGNPQPWPESEAYNKLSVPEKFQPVFENLGTVAFVIIKDSTLLFEQYWEDYSPHSRSNSFSMAKSIVSLAIGCAIDDGFIKNVDQPVNDFYPEFKGYFGDVSWMNIQTKEGTISLTNETPDAYIGVYQPRDGRDRLLYTLPESGISVLNVIPPVRNKVNSTDLCGPSSQPKWVNGPQTGRVIFRFM